jgi:hypothetical protein
MMAAGVKSDASCEVARKIGRVSKSWQEEATATATATATAAH